MKKRILACLLTLCMLVGLVTVFGVSAAAATGTQCTMTQLKEGATLEGDDVVTISSAEELNFFAEYVNNGGTTENVTFELTKNIVLNDGTFTAAGEWKTADGTADMSGTPVAFAPIGNATAAFEGTFNGNGYTINGLYINSADSNVGLFGCIASAARINDVTVKNSYVAAISYVGGIVGLAKSVLGTTPVVDNCINYGVVVAAQETAGGIVGGALGVKIYNSSNYGTVTGADKATNIGGILGHGRSAIVANTFNSGAVGGDVSLVNVGGIVGATEGNGACTVIKSLNVGSVQTTAQGSVGAIMGKSNPTLTISNNFYLSGSAASAGTPAAGLGNVGADVATQTAAVTALELKDAKILQELNVCPAGTQWSIFRPFVMGTENPEIDRTPALARISAGGKVYVAGTLRDAVAIAGGNAYSTIKLLRNGSTESIELGGVYTIDLNGYLLSVDSALTVSIGKIFFADYSEKQTGTLAGTTDSVLVMQGGSVSIKSGKYYSRDTYAIRNVGTGRLYLSGKPAVLSNAGPALYVGYANTLFAHDGAAKDPVSYTGNTITVDAGWTVSENSVFARGANKNTFKFSNYDQDKYRLEIVDGKLVAVHKMTTFQRVLSIVLLFIALVVLLILVRVLRKKATTKDAAARKQRAADKAAAEKAAAIAPVAEEPVVEEPVVEEAVVEEPVAEEPVAEEPVAEEPVVEEPVVEEPVVEEPVAEEPVAEEPVAEEPAVEAPVVVPPATKPDRVVVAETDAAGNVVYSTYKKSFTARMIQAPDDVQERYEALKNALLSYKKVNARVSWSYESFKSGRKQLAKFAIRGKTLCLFLAIDPDTLGDTKYNVTNVGDAKKYATVPCRLRLTSKRSLKWGLELIAKLAEQEALVPNPKYKAQSWRMENETTESLIEKNLIKKIQ